MNYLNYFVESKNNAEGKALALHAANPGLIHRTSDRFMIRNDHEGSGVNSEHRWSTPLNLFIQYI